MPATRNTVYQGALAPEAITVDITPGDSDLDLSGVVSATLEVYRSGALEDTWSCALSNQTESTVTLTYAFSAGDTDDTGTITLLPKLVAPGGTYRCNPLNVYIQSVG